MNGADVLISVSVEVASDVIWHYFCSLSKYCIAGNFFFGGGGKFFVFWGYTQIKSF